MKTITLFTGEQALLDDEDFERLSRFKWHFKRTRKTPNGYAVRTVWANGSSRKVFMHHDVFGQRVQLDHKNRNTLDNQRLNLRLATNVQNAGNKVKQGISSRYKGVCRHRHAGCWFAQIAYSLDGKRICRSLGYFHDEREAALVYNEAAKEQFGEFALLNQV